MPTHPRRWLAFRLRTLFVVVLIVAVALGAWVNYSLYWVRERRRFIAEMCPAKAEVSTLWGPKPGEPVYRRNPLTLRLMGEPRISCIVFVGRPTEPAILGRVEYLFPEATVYEGGLGPEPPRLRKFPGQP